MRILSFLWLLIGMVMLTSCIVTSEPTQIQELEATTVLPESTVDDEVSLPKEEVVSEESHEDGVPHYTTLVYNKPIWEEVVRTTETMTVVRDGQGNEFEILGTCGEGVYAENANEYYEYETDYFTVHLPYNHNWGTSDVGYSLVDVTENEFGRFWNLGRPYHIECSWMREMTISQMPRISMEEKKQEVQDYYNNYEFEEIIIQGYPALRVTADTLDTVDYYIFAEDYIYGISAMPFSAAPTEALLESFVLRD